jgi:hypothetical protein
MLHIRKISYIRLMKGTKATGMLILLMQIRLIKALFLIMLWLLYFTNGVLHRHHHQVQGQLVSHAHPHEGEHEHSDEELVYLDIISNPNLLIAHEAAIDWLHCSFERAQKLPFSAVAFAYQQIASPYLLRGPPKA